MYSAKMATSAKSSSWSLTEHPILQLFLEWLFTIFTRLFSILRAATPSVPLVPKAPEGPPAAPVLKVIDARCQRAKLLVQPQHSTQDESDEYQLRYRLDNEGDVSDRGDGDWEDSWIVEAFRTGTPRNIVPLHEHSKYKGRVRLRTKQGVHSEWSGLARWQTLLAPVNGGADMGEYTWGQNATDAWVYVRVPAEVKSKLVTVELKSQHLKVSYTLKATEVVLDHKLAWKVRLLTPEGGSHWEINRDDGKTSICVVLEKEKAAANLKWAFWRSIFEGHDEIDTHAFELDPHITEIVQSLHKQKAGGNLDPEVGPEDRPEQFRMGG